MIPSDPTNPTRTHGRATHAAIDLPRMPAPLAIPAAAPALPGQPTAMAQTPTLGALLHALRRRLALALTLATAAAAATVALLYFVVPPKYVATTRLELNSQPRRNVLRPDSDPEVDAAVFRANQKGIITSPLVLSGALNALSKSKLQGNPLAGQSPESLAGAIKTDFAQGPEIMQVKLYGNDPEYLADLLNTIVIVYTEELDRRDQGRKRVLVAELEKQRTEYQALLDKKREELRELEKNKKFADPQTLQIEYNAAILKQQGIIKTLGDVTDDRSTKESLRDSKKARVANIGKEPVPSYMLTKLLHEKIQASGYLNLLGAKDVEISHLKTYPPSTSRDSNITRLMQEKKALVDEIRSMQDVLLPQLQEEVRGEMERTLRNDLDVLETNIELLKIREERLRKEFSAVNSEVAALHPSNHRATVEVEKMRDTIEQISDTVKNLAREVALRKAEPTTGSRIVVLQPAEMPTDKDYSRLIKFAGAGGLSVFGLVLFGVAFLEFRSRKITDVEEVTHGLGLELVGTIPQLPLHARRPATGNASKKDAYWQSIITESVDAIRTQLLHAARADGLQVVMVTSASGGEGKTSLASQLAASLARSWRKTLLLDGDLRHPAAHKLFDLPLEPGFSEVLRGEATAGDCIKPTPLSRLWMMPAGNWDAHAVQALAQEGVGQLIAQLKEQYDFIVVDSCPVLPVADSLLLAQHVDGVIFSVLRDVSRLPAVQQAQQRLQGLGVRTLGAVVIGTQDDLQNLSFRYAVQANS